MSEESIKYISKQSEANDIKKNEVKKTIIDALNGCNNVTKASIIKELYNELNYIYE